MDNKRLRKLLVLALSTELEGEALAALRSVKRMLLRDKKDAHWLVAQLDGSEDRAQPQRHWTSPRTDTAVHWRDMVTYCLANYGWMTDWEENFMRSLVEQSEARLGRVWMPTTKQLAKLTKIHGRVQRQAQFWQGA